MSKILSFSVGITGVHSHQGIPLDLYAGILKQLAKHGQRDLDLDLNLAVFPGATVEADGGIMHGKSPVAHVFLRRNQKARFRLTDGFVAVGVSQTGDFRHAINADVNLLVTPPTDPILRKVHDWLCTGERGASSETMAHVLYGHPKSWTPAYTHPHDPGDFRRCLGFVKAVPESRARLNELRRLSPIWDRYVDRWDEMQRLLESGGSSGNAEPGLYKLMRQIQDEPTATA